MLKKSLLLIIALIALFFSACNSANIQKDEKVQKANVSLTNTYWKVISLYGEKVQISRKEAHIRFDKNSSVNGSLGCNNFFGSFKTDNENITFGNIASTRMMCQDMKTEDKFSKVFQDIKIYKIKGETLNFFDDKNKKISTFKAVYF